MYGSHQFCLGLCMLIPHTKGVSCELSSKKCNTVDWPSLSNTMYATKQHKKAPCYFLHYKLLSAQANPPARTSPASGISELNFEEWIPLSCCRIVPGAWSAQLSLQHTLAHSKHTHGVKGCSRTCLGFTWATIVLVLIPQCFCFDHTPWTSATIGEEVYETLFTTQLHSVHHPDWVLGSGPAMSEVRALVGEKIIECIQVIRACIIAYTKGWWRQECSLMFF